MSELVIRAAIAEDADRLAEIVNAEPGEEPIALMGGDVELARRYGIGLFKLDKIPDERRVSIAAEQDGVVVGALQYEFGDLGRPHSRGDVASMLLRVLGPLRFVRRLRAIQSRTRVDIPVPPGSFHLANLHVAPGYQDRGIGGMLLRWSEQKAIELDAPRMTLITTIGHDRIPWYERHGFVVRRTAADPMYERYTHVAGRVLMIKELSSGATRA